MDRSQVLQQLQAAQAELAKDGATLAEAMGELAAWAEPRTEGSRRHTLLHVARWHAGGLEGLGSYDSLENFISCVNYPP